MRVYLLPLLSAAAAAANGTLIYKIQPVEGASTALTVEKTGLLRGKKHLLVFNRYEGTLQFDRQQPERSRIQLSIQANSIECKDTWIDEKDRKKVMDAALNDMLAASQYPEIRFNSTAIRVTGNGRYQVEGDLIIRGRSKPAVVNVSLDSNKEEQLAFKGEAHIRLTDYGLKPPSAALGAVGTKDEMTFAFRVITRTE